MRNCERSGLTTEFSDTTRSTKDALRKIWKEIEAGNEWIVDADLRDFFWSAEHEKIVTLVSQRLSDGRVLRLIEAMLKAGSYGEGRLFPSERGTPQGGVASPLLSNILLTPLDREMRQEAAHHLAITTASMCRSAPGPEVPRVG